MTRPTFDAVTAGLTTKSDMIRALARAGYLRAEIASFLAIRYQHVRKVLLDAGISEGLSRGSTTRVELEREPVEVEVEGADVVGEAPARPVTSWEVLLRAGFHFFGECQSAEDGFIFDVKATTDAGVYAFVVEDIIMYVGLTQKGLRQRLEGYRRGHERQRTNYRVKALILEALAAGKRVKVLVATPEPTEWNGLPVMTAAGLEAGLISRIQPSWNILGVGRGGATEL